MSQSVGKSMGAGSGRIPGLDAMRGIAAIGVAIHHYGSNFGTYPVNWLFSPLYNAGGYFVEFFFVLSGFLLAKVYQPHTPYRVLFVRRFARLFPLHWLILIVVALGQFVFFHYTGLSLLNTATFDWWHFFLNLLLLQQIGLQNGFSFNGPSWSISAEWVVNLVFFYFLLKPKLLPMAALMIALGSAIILGTTQTKLASFELAFGVIDSGLLRAAFGFFIGVGLALIDKRLPDHWAGHMAWEVIAVFSAILAALFFAVPAINSIMTFQFITVGLVMPFLVLACSRARFIGSALSLRPLVWLGEISFAVYLIHDPLQMFIRGFRSYYPLPLNSGEGLLLFVILLCLLSHIAFFYFERPAQSFLRKALLPARVARNPVR